MTNPRPASARIEAFAVRARRPIRDALILVGLGRAAWFFWVQGIQPWTFAGVDARAYWNVDLAHPYAGNIPGDISAFLYSPAFAQVMAPFSLLPFEAFFVLWTAMNVVLLAWLVRPWPWAVPMLILPIVYELCVGNVHFLMAALAVLAVRYPIGWAFFVLTKITPGVGALWFAARGAWRAFVVAVGGTLVIAAASYAIAPGAWHDWVAFLTASPGGAEWIAVRLPVAAALVVFAARTDRAWLVPVAVWLALPVVYVNSWVVLLGAIRVWHADRPATA